jgi:hypothetical protein
MSRTVLHWHEYNLCYQIHAMVALPPFAVHDFWSAFAANHLVKLASALRTLSRPTQRRATSTLIQILSLLPDPKTEPYFRKFLCSPQSNGLATLVADAFNQGIDWIRPSGPGHICSLIIHFLFWCDARQGDDRKACINASVRNGLADKLNRLVTMENDGFNRLPEQQRVDVQRLQGTLVCIESMPGDSFLRSTKDHLEGQLERCEKESCMRNAELTCGKCKSVRYCGKQCQTWHWKNGHKLRCFQTVY